jgi:hypothetical protein
MIGVAFDESSRWTDDATMTGAETPASIRHRGGCTAPQWPGWREILRMRHPSAEPVGHYPRASKLATDQRLCSRLIGYPGNSG